MSNYYSSEKNTQMLIALMKEHGIKKIIVSPGATNVCFVGSVQQDSYFEIYSSVDERSAAYMACGLAAESGEAVALSCTGATASRNYIPGLTEAYYRQLPVLAITSTQHIGKVGNYVPQVIDRSTQLKDMVKMSVDIPTINSSEDEWAYGVQLNKAILELTHRGGGPVHINITTSYNPVFSVKELPKVKVIKRISLKDKGPSLIQNGRVGIFVGTYKKWDSKLTVAVDKFCEAYNGVVFCDRTGNYFGKYRINPCLVGGQIQYTSQQLTCDVLIHIGSVSGTDNHMGLKPKEVWRVNVDGEIRDTFRKLNYIFEMDEIDFFERYCAIANAKRNTGYYDSWKRECSSILNKLPELPFSNAWIAQNTIDRMPEGCVLHLGILNSLRSWNYFESKKEILGYSNTGGFGIDGGVSSLIGASLFDKNRIFFGVVGDLAFFYDMNAAGNRHVGNNLRLMVINNGRGQEFRNSLHHASRFGQDADQFMAAAGHFGNKSPCLLKHYAEDLGYEYLCASTPEEYLENVGRFTKQEIGENPIIFEIFTDTEKETEAFDLLHNIETSTKETAKKLVKDVLGENGVKTLKKFIKR